MKELTDQKRHAIIVLGMHRSGTSAVTGVLNLLGVDLGSNLMAPAQDNNETGFWEHLDIYETNEKLLQGLNSSWDDVRSFPDGWLRSNQAELYKLEIISILERDFANSPFWAVKDPRICRFLPLWRPILEETGNNPYFLIVVRNPLEVVASLAKRDGFPKGKSCLLWLKHMIDAEKETRNTCRMFVTYEEFLSDWKGLSSRIAQTFGFKWPVDLDEAASQVEVFLQSSLRHNIISDTVLVEDEALSKWIRDAYLAVEEAVDGDDSRLIKTMDAIEVELRDVEKLYASVLTDFRDRYSATNAALQDRNQQIDHLNTRLEESQQARGHQLAEINHLQEGITEREDRIQGLDAEVAGLREGVTERDERIKGLDAEVAGLRGVLGEREDQIQHFRCQVDLLHNQVEAILDSTSWKLTAPLRWISVNTKKFKRKIMPALYFFDRQYRTIKKSGLFDAPYYLEKNPDVAESGINPVIHYLAFGSREGRDPNPFFDTSYYQTKNRDVLEAKINPLYHFIAHGAKKGISVCQPHKKIEVESKHQKSKQTPSEFRNCIRDAHLIFSFFMKSIRQPVNIIQTIRSYRRICSSNYMDKIFYVESYPDVLKAGIHPTLHYLTRGWLEGRNPSAHFNTDAYLHHNPDVRKYDINPLVHYILYGQREGRRPGFTSQPLHTAQWDEDCRFYESLEIRFSTHKVLQFCHPVTVVVPCYVHNKRTLNLLSALADSLNTAYPHSQESLTFIFIDDASPFSDVRTLYKSNTFFNRQDVQVRFNKENIGFLRTINLGLKAATGDVVILNSDTVVYKECFEILQDVAYRENKIGSVTPVSNKATIASIPNWPNGNTSVMEQSNSEVAEAIRNFGLIAPEIEAPTGHGFCMYMTREALEQVGYFDECYGRGYGEENDWCQRGIESGFKHLITTETYVFHNDTSSFTSEEKQRLVKQNFAQLINGFPHYNRDVAEYVQRDPLKLHRLLLTLRISEIKKKHDKTKTILYILQDDILNHYGGTQKHVKEIAESIHQYGAYECLVLCPQTFADPSKVWLYYFCSNHEWDLRIPLTYQQLRQLLPYILHRTNVLHFQHSLGWPQEFLETIYAVKDMRKIFTFHDFQPLCVNPNLLYNNKYLCSYKDDPECCKKCFKQSKTVDRTFMMHFLTSFDCLLTPSEDTKRWIQHILKRTDLKPRIRVLPHYLDFAGIPFTHSSESETRQKKIIFLGYGSVHKGIKLFDNAYHRLSQLGLHPEIWGESPHTTEIPSKPFFGWKNLRFLQTADPAYIVVIPSIGPETFSYTLYEALFLLEVPVVVGPFGNPAKVTQQERVGIAMSDVSTKSLIEAVKKIDRNYATYYSAVKSFKKQYEPSFTKSHYFKEYIQIIDPNAAKPSRPVNIRKLVDSVMEKASSLSDLYPFTALFISGLYGPSHAPWRYRVKHPAALLQKTDCTSICRSHTDGQVLNDLIKTDVIILHRVPISELIQDVVSTARNRNIPIIFDTDDLVFINQLERYFPFWDDLSSIQKAEYSIMTQQLELTAKACDYISCSSEIIAEYASYLKKPSYVMRNFVLEASSSIHCCKKKQDKDGIRRIGYFSGSNTHDSDFNWIAPFLGQLLSRYPQIRLTIMGHFQADDFIMGNKKQIDREPYSDYDGYLAALNSCDIALAPLSCKNDFTRAKSAVKFLEAGLMRVPVIATPIPEMIYYITHGKNGWLPRDQREWITCLNHVINISKVNKAGEEAYRSVLSMGSDIAIGTQLHQILQSIIDTKK